MRDVSVDDFSLPAWIYSDPEFFALERARVFRPSWQIICHVSEIPNAGDYQCFDFIGEMLFAIRGGDGIVRAFHNVCRHRASRLLDGPRGHCARRIVCPYHAWSYDLAGGLASVGDRSAFPQLDLARESLVPVEMEIYAGFVFVRIEPGSLSVAQMMTPYAGEIATHEFEKLEPIGRVTLRPRKVNWKNVGDNYSDGLHITVAHPGLTRLFGSTYRVESREWIDRMSGELSDTPSRNWAERMYLKYLPHAVQAVTPQQTACRPPPAHHPRTRATSATSKSCTNHPPAPHHPSLLQTTRATALSPPPKTALPTQPTPAQSV
jgi:phenylpropionate dioxygenase-like ring-hydroxylating dioxygenase large terminal subunit